MDIKEVVRRSKRRLNQGREVATHRLSSALSMVSLGDLGRQPPNRDSHGWTVLHLAARHSKPQTVRIHLEQGEKVTDKDTEGNTPLHLAAENGNKEAARVLLHHGASSVERNNTGLSSLHVAAKSGHSSTVALLLEHTSQMDHTTTTGLRTALHLAASRGTPEVVRVLLTAGANPRAKATQEMTPLHFSAREGHLETSHMLVIKGAKVDAATTSRWTPLMLAAAYNRLEVAKFLLSKGADIRLTNDDGLSADVIAAGKGFSSIAVKIREASTPSSQPANNNNNTTGGTPTSTTQDSPNITANTTLNDIHNLSESVHVTSPNSEHGDDDTEMAQHMTSRETRVLKELRTEMMKIKEAGEVLEEGHGRQLTEKDAELREAQVQILEAGQVESDLRAELARVKRDIDMLEQKDRELRNEVTTMKRLHRTQKETETGRLTDCNERINQYLADTKEKVKQRQNVSDEKDKSKETVKVNQTLQLEGLNIEKELECPICFELSRPPIYQCPEGHIICNDCRPKVSRCPVCRFVFQGTPDIRNRFVERLALRYFSNI